MTDIVTRLRAANKDADEVASVFLTDEAAEAIEILRYDQKWLLHHIQLMECGCKTCTWVLQTQRGYLDIVKKGAHNG